MDEQEFKKRSDESLNSLYNKLATASSEADFEVDLTGGALAIEFEEPPGKFVVSPNAPVRQIWVSAHSKSYKLDWNDAQSAFVLPATGQSLDQLIGDAIAKQLGEEVAF
jgi:iron donor protein CyaY